MSLTVPALVLCKTTSGRIGQDDGIMVYYNIHGLTMGIHSVSDCERTYVVTARILLLTMFSIPAAYAAYKLYLELWCIAYGLIY